MAEFVTSAERGRRIGVIIACSILITAALALGIISFRKMDEIRQGPENKNNLLKLRAQVQEKEAELEKVRQEIRDFGVHFGWQDVSVPGTSAVPGSIHDPEEVKRYLDWAVDELRRLKIEGHRKYSEEDGAGDPLTLKGLFKALEEQKAAYEKESEDFKVEIEALEKKYRDELAVQKKNNEQETQNITEKVERLGGLMGQQLERDNDRDRELREAEMAKSAKQEELTALVKRNVEIKKRSENQKAELDSQVAWLVHHDAEAADRMDPDGKILFVDNKLKTAWINLCRKDRLFPGSRFEVYRAFQGGLKVLKGSVMVTKVEEDRSLVVIERLYTDQDIEPEDRLFSRYFEADRPSYVAFAGHLTGTLSNTEASRLLKNKGDVPQNVVDEKTDYVIAGEGYEEDPNFQKALKWGAKMLMERYLYDYLGVPY